MTKIYDALQIAGQHKDIKPKKTMLPVPKDDKPELLFELKIEETLASLHRNITNNTPNLDSRIIQFVDAKDGAGGEVLIREYAKVSAIKLNKTVLLLDAFDETGSCSEFFESTDNIDWTSAMDRPESLREGLAPIGDSSLYVANIESNSERFNLIFEGESSSRFFGELRKAFELILVNIPQKNKGCDTLLSKVADGIVIVVESNKTRWQVANQVKKRIQTNGGNLIGVIMNNRTYPIPSRIYERL